MFVKPVIKCELMSMTQTINIKKKGIIDHFSEIVSVKPILFYFHCDLNVVSDL